MLPGFPKPALARALTLESSQSLPAMSSATAPSGIITFSSQNDTGTYAAWNAFDQATASTWGSNYGTALPQWVQRQTPSAITIGRIGIGYSNAGPIANAGPVDFVFAGSNDGTNFTTLITKTGEAWSGGYAEKYYDVASPAAFNRHRLTVSANANPGTLVLINELILLQLL